MIPKIPSSLYITFYKLCQKMAESQQNVYHFIFPKMLAF